jgi:mannose-1-phosphate guanylyltransferase / phosphomannomutase
VMSIGKVLEIVARSGRSLAELVADLPRSTMVRRSVECPWSLKGVAMRRLIEAVKGMQVDNTDGIKVFEDDGWAQVIPDPDEPVFHIWAEGTDEEESERLEEKYRDMLEEIVSSEPTAAQTLN